MFLAYSLAQEIIFATPKHTNILLFLISTKTSTYLRLQNYLLDRGLTTEIHRLGYKNTPVGLDIFI